MTRYRISEMTEHYAKHDMIHEHTKLPPIAGPRLRMLFAFLDQQPALSKHSELYTLVISLVQLGMDTHDLIDTETARRSEKEMRSRQLNVLAGDFFSARFYQLLAESGQIEMISRISNAVCEVNRLKVNLYMRMRQLRLTADEYFSFAVQLRSEMFQQFSSLLEGTLSRLWPEMLSGVSRFEVALDEIERSSSKERFEKSWAYWHLLQVGSEEERHRLTSQSFDQSFINSMVDKYDIRDQLHAKLKFAADSMKLAAGKLESDMLTKELSGIMEGLINKLNISTPALNEMR
ncbi:heptaprenyl diphosphate synthase component 1 [Paenibacillus sp. GSMTC-2017]|uniref:heptaprenyl diphosphate synthase component 1 n=1 Tax=Paenibacillus sp. GSMTC-2017 TaxID=2794350 RepID=UPI0018DA32DF|nr:heptaprenyl diphosphate synthase component 1 [Paenibacillus sp. GSMTC-2017]MBH5317962.1 heptaprenyl diphosphate synthase component 1 [Paenibacillus sp. GSMTC-2017]